MVNVRSFLQRLNGPQTLGNSAWFWGFTLALIVIAAVLPNFISRYQVITTSSFFISAILALSLCLIWGYCGILSLGQASFYCIGGYAFGIVGINTIEAHGNTWLALLAGIAVPVMAAAVLGLMMFYRRLHGVYVAILMLVVSLLLGLFMRQTADPTWHIGKAALGGMNGLKPLASGDPQIPAVTLGFGSFVAEFDGRQTSFYWLCLTVLVLVFLGLRLLVNSSFGYVMQACREDLERAETFGYDVRLIQLAAFCISGGIAGLAGTLYTSWGTYIHPDGFSVAPNILVVIWVAVGGRKDMMSVIISTIALCWLSLRLTSYGEISLFILGLILVVAMLLAREGVVMAAGERIGRWLNAPRRRAVTADVRKVTGE